MGLDVFLDGTLEQDFTSSVLHSDVISKAISRNMSAHNKAARALSAELVEIL